MCTRNLFPPRQIASSPVKDLAFTYGSVLPPGISKFSEVSGLEKLGLNINACRKKLSPLCTGGVWQFAKSCKIDKLASQSVSFGELCMKTPQHASKQASVEATSSTLRELFPTGFRVNRISLSTSETVVPHEHFLDCFILWALLTYSLTKVSSRLPAYPQLAVSPYSYAIHKALKVNPWTVEELTGTNNGLNTLQSNWKVSEFSWQGVLDKDW